MADTEFLNVSLVKAPTEEVERNAAMQKIIESHKKIGLTFGQDYNFYIPEGKTGTDILDEDIFIDYSPKASEIIETLAKE
jgi:hypothetical protein